MGTGKKPTVCLRQAEVPVKAHTRPARQASGGRRSLAEALCQELLRTNRVSDKAPHSRPEPYLRFPHLLCQQAWELQFTNFFTLSSS